MKKLSLFSLPLILFCVLAVFLFRGLKSDPSELESVLIGKPVPAFLLQDIYEQGRIHEASIFLGQPMLLNVWATWCPTCYAEHQFLNELAAKGVKIIGLNYKDDRIKAINWLKQLGDPYDITLFDESGLLALDLGVYGAPETFFIDAQGIIHHRHVGDLNPRNWGDELASVFEKMR